MYPEKLGVISQTLWIQNVLNFNHALVLPPLSLRDKEKKKIERERERVCIYKKEFISLKLLICFFTTRE